MSDFVISGRFLTSYSCPNCSTRFPNTSSLQLHYDAVHLKLRPHACRTCGKTYGRKADLNRHVASVHLRYKNERPLITMFKPLPDDNAM